MSYLLEWSDGSLVVENLERNGSEFNFDPVTTWYGVELHHLTLTGDVEVTEV